MILLPPIWFRWVFGAGSLLAVAASFYFDVQNFPLALTAYTASALGFYYIITVTFLPLGRLLKRVLWRFPFFRRYFADREFRLRTGLYFGTAVNLAYVGIKLFTGIRYHSVWLVTAAGYYTALTGVRSLLVLSDLRTRRSKASGSALRKQWEAFRLTGILMLLMNLTLSGIIVLAVRDSQSDSYPGFFIIGAAAYTFYRFITSILKQIRRRKSQNPLFAAVVNVDFSFALTSLFTLQTAMLAAYDHGDHVKGANVLTGTVVSALILAIAFVMIVRGNRELKRTDS